MGNVLFVTWDGGGNLPPALGIAQELADRGDQVRFLGHEQQRHAVESAGFAFTPYTHARPWSATAPVSNLRGALRYFAMFTDRGPGRDLLQLFARDGADVLVVDCMSLGALGAARKLAVPRAVLVHTYYRYLTGAWDRGPIGLLGRLKGLNPARLWATADRILVAADPTLDPAG
ncbi:MAG: glycosyltransferase, partial [Mycobacteriales bacterium]